MLAQNLGRGHWFLPGNIVLTFSNHISWIIEPKLCMFVPFMHSHGDFKSNPDFILIWREC